VRETLVVSAQLAELGRARDWTEAVARSFTLPPSTLFAIQLCCEEALSNIARYAFDDTDYACRELHLCVERESDEITVTIEDQGKPFDPWSVPPPPKPATIEEASAGGWGLQLIRKFARSHNYERRDAVNRLTLTFLVAENSAAPLGDTLV